MAKPLQALEVPIRVRYPECDPMNVAHHSVYPVWIEIARTELLRGQGVSYAELEKQGVFFVVARLSFRYRRPAHYDDELRVRCVAQPIAGVKIDHDYQIHRGEELIATASTTIVCVDEAGKVRPVPDFLVAGE